MCFFIKFATQLRDTKSPLRVATGKGSYTLLQREPIPSESQSKYVNSFYRLLHSLKINTYRHILLVLYNKNTSNVHMHTVDCATILLLLVTSSAMKLWRRLKDLKKQNTSHNLKKQLRNKFFAIYKSVKGLKTISKALGFQ